MLVALLRAIGQMKAILDESDRGCLKDLVLASSMHPRILSIGIRLAILDHDTQFDSPEADEANLEKRRQILTELISLIRGAQARGAELAGKQQADDDQTEDYEDDFEDDDMMMPDEDAVRDDQADSTAERDEEAQRQAQVREIAATVAKQKELLAQKMRLVEDQLSRLTALKSEAEARMRQAQQEAEDEDDGEDEETDEEEGSVEEESWDEDSDEWDDDDFQDFDLSPEA